jgi:hypothetical protein
MHPPGYVQHGSFLHHPQQLLQQAALGKAVQIIRRVDATAAMTVQEAPNRQGICHPWNAVQHNQSLYLKCHQW